MRDLSVNLGAGVRTPTGDWATVDGLAGRRASLLRRLTTPQGALWYDRTYGNPAYARMSQPATTVWLEQITADYRQAAEQETGVKVVDVRLQRQDNRASVLLHVIWDDTVADTVQAVL